MYEYIDRYRYTLFVLDTVRVYLEVYLDHAKTMYVDNCFDIYIYTYDMFM